MNLDHLKKLKNVKPRPSYVSRSRAEILTTPVLPQRASWRQIVFGMAQSGSAIALMGIFFVFLAGGFSLMKVVGWDRQSITVEAQAIDMQIQLADLKYTNTNFINASGNAVLKTVTARPVVRQQITSGKSDAQGGKVTVSTSTVVVVNSTSTVIIGTGSVTTTTSTPKEVIGVDRALDALSK
jgi:hypothetical protein